MLGTIFNTCTILTGGLCGALLKKGIGERYRKSLFDALGLSCIALGLNASLSNMAKSEVPVLFIVSLAIGGVIGTMLDLQGRLDRANARLNARQGGENNALQGLVTASLLYCIGTFAIVGPILSALSPTKGWAINESANTFLYSNATLDFFSTIVMTASYGWIILLAAPILFCWQGMFYLIGYFGGDIMPQPMIAEVSIVGGVLILSSGLSILHIKDCKTVNLLPALLVPVVFYIIKGLL